MAGKLVHFELTAADATRAKTFWSSLFGWRFQGGDGPMEYHLLEGADPGGAIYPAEERDGHPTVYFDCDDIDATIARVRELGGTADGKMAIPGIGWITRCVDTEGNRFSLFASDESAPPS